jgi:hypothetical protein
MGRERERGALTFCRRQEQFQQWVGRAGRRQALRGRSAGGEDCTTRRRCWAVPNWVDIDSWLSPSRLVLQARTIEVGCIPAGSKLHISGHRRKEPCSELLCWCHSLGCKGFHIHMHHLRQNVQETHEKIIHQRFIAMNIPASSKKYPGAVDNRHN